MSGNDRNLETMLEEVRHWAKSDSDGELRKTIFRERAEINAQVLILQRLPPDVRWDIIAVEFQLTPAEVQDLRIFYGCKCLSLLRKFRSKQRYLE